MPNGRGAARGRDSDQGGRALRSHTTPSSRARGTQLEDLGAAERLQKVMAAAGIGSRRASEELIAAGRVTVNGKVAELGDRANAETDEIIVDGERIVTDAKKVYLAINKPAGVVSTMSDERGRAALADYLGNLSQRVYHVGRLDQDSEGLLLLTNDGDLAHKLMHPSYGVQKTYLAEVSGPIRKDLKKQLLAGVDLEDGLVMVGQLPGGRLDARQGAGRGGVARGAQAHRAAAARRGRLPGDAARAYRDWSYQDRRSQVRAYPQTHPRRGRRPVQGRRGLTPGVFLALMIVIRALRPAVQAA